ncbi:hypothetical protein [Bacillus haynesii]
MKTEIRIAAKAVPTVAFAPAIIRENISLPKWSVPSQCCMLIG